MASITGISKQGNGILEQYGSPIKAMAPVDAEIQSLNEQIDNAHKMTDIRAVIERLKCWTAANPQYRDLTYPIFEQLYRREEGAQEAIAEAEMMGLSAEEQEQRDRLFQLRLRVRAEDDHDLFLAALGEARQALTEWKSVHPDDPMIALLNEHLDMEEEIATQLHTL